MFIIIGTKIRKEDRGCLPEMRLCPRCRRVVYERIIREQRWFSVFWVPLFPIHTEEYLQCPCCGLTFPTEQAGGALINRIPDTSASTVPQNGALPDQGAGAAPPSMLQEGALTDQGAGATASSMLQKGARQAGRLYGKLLKYLE